MSMMIYLGTDTPIDPQAGRWLTVAPVDDSTSRWPAQLATQYCYLAQSYTGNGSGFQCGQHRHVTLAEERRQMYLSLLCLADYLEEQSARAHSFALHACWDGTQDAPVEHRRLLDRRTLTDKGFYFLDGELSRYRPRPRLRLVVSDAHPGNVPPVPGPADSGRSADRA